MKIKQLDEDFVVKEVLNLKIEQGDYNYYLLTKKDWNTHDVVEQIKRRLNTDVGFAGNKDKNAVTSQYISVYRKKIDFVIKDAKFEFVGTGKERVFLGKLKGNEFIITIRDLDKKLKPVKTVINYYGEQRFSEKNALIGKLIVTKKFKEACDELELKYNENDYVNALRRLGITELKFYIHAYQSELWNKLAMTSKKKVLPIIGFLTTGKDYDKIMKAEGVTKESFIVRNIPELSSEGGERNRIVKVQKFKTLAFEGDELNKGKMKQTVSFFLEKGAYATTVINALNL
jgi:tRNA(Glu) U13 pseudouridine synthase TruD